MNQPTAGQARAAQLRATTPEEHLRTKAKEILRIQIRDMRINAQRNMDRTIPAPRTRYDAGVIDGRIQAYLDAIMAIQAGSAYYVDNSWNLRNELYAEASAETVGS
jgi:hypothetical protein